MPSCLLTDQGSGASSGEDRAVVNGAGQVVSAVPASVPSVEDAEIALIQAAYCALRVLNPEGRTRAVDYLRERLGIEQNLTIRLVTPQEEVIVAVAQAAGFTVADLTGKSRVAPVVRARNAAAYALSRLGHSSADIGDALGGRDHTTVLHALKSARADTAPYFCRLVDAGLAQAIEARRAETQGGSVHDSPVADGGRNA